MHFLIKIIILQLVIYSQSEGLTKDAKVAEVKEELLLNDTQDDKNFTNHKREPRQLQAILPLLQQQVSQQQQGLSPLLSSLLGGLPVQQGQTAGNAGWQLGGLPGSGGGLGVGQSSGGGLNLGGLPGSGGGGSGLLGGLLGGGGGNAGGLNLGGLPGSGGSSGLLGGLLGGGGNNGLLGLNLGGLLGSGGNNGLLGLNLGGLLGNGAASGGGGLFGGLLGSGGGGGGGGGLLNIGGLVGALLSGLLGGGGGGGGSFLPINLWNGQPSFINPWQLGNLGGLGQGGNQGGLMCPLTHRLTCRCEPLMSFPMRSYERADSLEILQHSESSNEDGSNELSATLSNGLSVYQRSTTDKNANNVEVLETEGFYSLKLEENSYFNIYFKINNVDFTVKADVTADRPKSGMKKNV